MNVNRIVAFVKEIVQIPLVVLNAHALKDFRLDQMVEHVLVSHFICVKCSCVIFPL